ncbi:LamG-like jellyroll fold domain-containing protein [Acinetobacter sp. HY1485]|uniref:LamG-like jellyroll fold domain-containing protein n=1 Tax=Acinetobacter sp. HY1485 TaxID=2970918 RepID=UPI0022B9D1B5|nr:LamG-like jellyroll fold domain-containing protein [Acinetobacter sp. HY1485]
MSNITLTWDSDGSSESFSVYRAEQTIDTSNLPTPIATGITDKTYIDSDIIEDKTYFYRVASNKGNQQKISDEISIIATNHDQYFQFVDFLLFADGDMGTATFVDASQKKRTVKASNVVLTKPKFSQYIKAKSAQLSANISTLGISDFTLEIWVCPSSSSSSWARVFQIGSEGAGYLSLFRNSNTTPMQFILHARDSSGSSVSLINADKAINTETAYSHICLMRKDGVFYLFIDGILSGSNSQNTALRISLNTLYLLNNNQSAYLNALFDSFRLTTVARYDPTGFQVPAKAFGRDVSNDKFSDKVDLLIDANETTQIGVIKDLSSNARTLSLSGTLNLLMPKFSDGLIEYNPSTSSLSTQVEVLNTSDFTLESWLMIDIANSINNGRLWQLGENTTQGMLNVYLELDSKKLVLSIYTNSSYQYLATLNIDSMQMMHLCLMRKDGVFYLFKDGVAVQSTALEQFTSYSISSSNLKLFSDNAGRDISAHLDSLRLTQLARYEPKGFTPPITKFLSS